MKTFTMTPAMQEIEIMDTGDGYGWQVGSEFEIRWTMSGEKGVTRMRVTHLTAVTEKTVIVKLERVSDDE